ncbi:MAG: alanine racemase [Bdellovibrionales bacterium]
MFRPTRIEVSRAAITHNLQLLKKWNGAGAFFCPMVKANAYGHGEVEVAHIVEKSGVATAMGVALYEEGLRLREAGITKNILVFAPIDPAAASAAITHQLTPVVGRFEDFQALLTLGNKNPLAIHLKFNTGMNRLGFDEIDLLGVRETLKQNPHLQVEGVCTHLSHGEEAHHPDGYTQKQFARFQAMTVGLPGVRHAHKSASLAALAEHSIAIDPAMGGRPGISIYGLPQDGHTTAQGLRAALRWSTELIRFHKVAKGEAVGYGARWIASRDSTIGIVPVGYGDGYQRALSNKGEMLYRETRVPVVGSVCMDYTLVDLTEALKGEGPRAGEEIVILGTQGKAEVSAGFLAEKAGTIAYEIVTGIQRRVAREVI